MFTQAIAKKFVFENLFTQLFSTLEGKSQISAQDLGFEIDEIELADEMFAQLNDNFAEETLPQVDPDEFEAIFRPFLS